MLLSGLNEIGGNMDNQIAVVTGSSSGFGLLTSLDFSEKRISCNCYNA